MPHLRPIKNIYIHFGSVASPSERHTLHAHSLFHNSKKKMRLSHTHTLLINMNERSAPIVWSFFFSVCGYVFLINMVCYHPYTCL